MTRNYHDNEQRFHKARQGRILVPHEGQSGILLTVNPRQTSRARREAQNFFLSITNDLRALHDEAQTLKEFINQTNEQAQCENENENGIENRQTLKEAMPNTTAGRLAKELAEAAAAGPSRGLGGTKRLRNEYENRDRLNAFGKKISASPMCGWFEELETACKGYLLLRVPTQEAIACHAGKSSTLSAEETKPLHEEEKKVKEHATVASSSSSPVTQAAHTILINPFVTRVVDRIFTNLEENPRPVFKHCFRLIPVELTCCPTMLEMETGLRRLLDLHFPVNHNHNKSKNNPHINTPFPEKNPTPRMHKIVLRLIIKNNTNVEAKKSSYQSTLQCVFPANRFIVLSPSYLTSKAEVKAKVPLIQIEAVVTVLVLHATCVMGVQRLFHQREGYNVHNLGAKALVLSNSVTHVGKQKEE